MEAMACGLPVVVPEIGDLADVVEDGVTGFLVRPPERKGFVRSITRLLEDEVLRHRMGESALWAVSNGFTVEAGAQSWRAILETL